MVVDDSYGDRDIDVGVSNDQETDMEEKEDADFEIYKIICLFLNLLIFLREFSSRISEDI